MLPRLLRCGGAGRVIGRREKWRREKSGWTWTFLDVFGCSWLGRRKSLDESNNAAGKGTDTPAVTSEAPVSGPLRTMYQAGESARKKIEISVCQALLDRCRVLVLSFLSCLARLFCSWLVPCESSTFTANNFPPAKAPFVHLSLPAVDL